jgi:hypothetical protein
VTMFRRAHAQPFFHDLIEIANGQRCHGEMSL